MAFLGGPIALLITLPGTAWLIEEIGWRWTWASLGIGGGLIVIAVALLIVRQTPQEMGLQPDGFVPEPDEDEGASREAPKQAEEPYEYPWTRREAMHTWAFWSLGLAFGVSQLGAGTFVLFRIPYFEEKGFSPALSGAAAATDALVVVLGLLALAPFIDRMSLRHGGALGVFLTMVALAIALVADTAFLMFFSNFVFGVGQVFNSAVRNVIWSTYYGRANIGSIRGTAFLVQMMFGAAGPPLAGLLRDSSGGYELAWLMSLLPMAVGTALIYLTRAPVPKGQREDTSLAVSS
jgi:MFS family permease